MQYKCVPAPTGLVIDKNGSFEGAVRSYADLINREAADGWTLLYPMENIEVTRKPGCVAALLGNLPLIGQLFPKEITVEFKMLVFSKD
jgi:hypothetical protein